VRNSSPRKVGRIRNPCRRGGRAMPAEADLRLAGAW
jgi:hypothetical protein